LAADDLPQTISLIARLVINLDFILTDISFIFTDPENRIHCAISDEQAHSQGNNHLQNQRHSIMSCLSRCRRREPLCVKQASVIFGIYPVPYITFLSSKISLAQATYERHREVGSTLQSAGT